MRVDPTPYRLLKSHELAKWLEATLPHGVWLIDGDPLLTSLLDMPATTEELAAALRRLDHDLFVRAKAEDLSRSAEPVDAKELDRLVVTSDDSQSEDAAHLKTLYLRWKNDDTSEEWILSEDRDE